MRAVRQSLFLALSDYLHERLLSACAVLGLAAVLTPLLVLLGVHHGIISAMTARLLSDPRTLEVIPVGSGKYGPAWFEELSGQPGVAFILPQTRSIAATMTLRHSGGQGQFQAVAPLTATAAGDPLLKRWSAALPGWKEQPPRTATVVLSESLAAKLKAGPGSRLSGLVDRMRGGRRETDRLPLEVLAVLPPEAQATDMMYVPLDVLVATEDYRDGRAVPFLGWPGDAPFHSPGTETAPKNFAEGAPEDAHGAFIRDLRGQREYASFRLYAAALDGVEPLRLFFQSRGIEVYVKSAEIETVRTLDRAFTVVFALITGAAMFGFCASTASSALAAVRRKSRSLGIMRLMGFSRGAMIAFPVAQTMLTGLFGSLLAFLLYAGVALSIDSLYAAAIPGSGPICTMPPLYAGAALLTVLLLSALSSLSAAWQVAYIEPSEVIRDI